MEKVKRSWEVRPASGARYMPGAEATQRLARVKDDEAPPLQLVSSRYGLSLAFDDGKLVNPRLRDLHRLGIRSCRLKDPLSLKEPLVLGDHFTIWRGASTGVIAVKFNGQFTAGFDWASMRWLHDRISNHSILHSGTVIQTQGAVRVLVARPTLMAMLSDEQSILS
ncbi:hypothetical protein [Arthrobacter caoxuetaonis]|uniref:Uncharacterized protein n=1 Tax=Arthrobacter caoxuetaonis TaxID=2886935 RepID=A0A9X1MI40_9MICC|nr:hypothetical protein [Arthrobacter caoxuetaonis]MCC3299317.1 hypothetical protein [Arthrobacter caoxuetaonis]USQ59190.1 hypothetical protein NF551_16535 [Arthrobacter caoxuetaonis]